MHLVVGERPIATAAVLGEDLLEQLRSESALGVIDARIRAMLSKLSVDALMVFGATRQPSPAPPYLSLVYPIHKDPEQHIRPHRPHARAPRERSVNDGRAKRTERDGEPQVAEAIVRV